MFKYFYSYSYFYLKFIAFLCNLVLLNFIIWISFQSTHHIYSNIDFVIFNNQVHVNSEEFVDNPAKNSSSRQNRNHQQFKFDCSFMSFNYSFQKFISQNLNENIIKIINNEKQDRYLNISLINENHYINFSNFKRGPPKLEYFSNFI